MPALNDIVVGAANLAVRTLVQRQATETLASSLSLPLTTTATVMSEPSTIIMTPVSTVSDNHSATPSTTPNGQGTSSPLLFFVALGFGVVFTNLWIIVGVKYCFRYNARNRALRMAEDGEPINMENMPRPHRRRREKKLMTMDEVNEKFPMQKYKNWVASRAQEGLPTAGGVSAPASRANSVRDVEGVVADMSKERDSTDERPMTSATSRVNANNAEQSDSTDKEKEKDKSKDTAAATGSANPTTAVGGSSHGQTPVAEMSNRTSQDDDDDDEDEQINAALPPECLGTSGDTCAICIDSLEDDDDVRGLTCGHAFHAGCLDPWLTSRRACCPLCKADYYTPKPRRTHADAQLPLPPADSAAPTEGSSGNNQQATPRIEAQLHDHRMNLPQPPQTAWQSIMARGRGLIPGGRQGARSSPPMRAVNTATRRTVPLPSSPASPSTTQASTPGVWVRFREAFPHFQLQNRIQSQTTVTPSQLESGVRS